MRNDFATVASYTYLWQAELARARLAGAGIRSFLGNAAVVLWSWELSNAVGGVSVHVNRCDAKAACGLLAPESPKTDKIEPYAICPHCAAAVPPSWSVCWRCGAAMAGGETVQPVDDEAASDGEREPDEANMPSVLSLAAVGLVLGSLASGGPLWAIISMPLVVLFVRLIQRLDKRSAATTDEAGQPPSAGPSQPPSAGPANRLRPGPTCRRRVQAASPRRWFFARGGRPSSVSSSFRLWACTRSGSCTDWPLATSP